MKNICQKMLSVIAILVLCLMCIANQFPLYSFAKEDDENVYGRMKPDGEIYKTIVNNEEQEDKELPIETEIKYYLDDEEISIDDLKGKSGKVKIAINLTNKDENTVNINGKNVTMYTPYIVGTSVILDNNKFSDVTISTGKVIDNGTDTVAIGIAMPGMQESLDLDIEDVEIPENITIEANCKDFELGNIYMYIQSDVFGSDSLDFLDEFESFYTDARELKSASTKLVDGTNSLKDGTKTYASKISEFNAGLSKYTSGVTSVRDNYEKIDSGISTINSSSKQIADGSNNLNNGIKELKSQLTTLVSGISQLQTGANAIDSGLGNIITSVEASINATSGSADISANLASLASATSQSISDLKATKASLQAVADAMSDTIPTLSADGSSITDEPNTAKTDILAQISALDAQITSLESNVNAERNAYQTALQATTASGLNDLLNGLQRLKVASSQVKSGLDNIVSQSPALNNGLTQLEEGSNTLATGAQALSNGTASLSSGSATLKSGLDSLNASTSTISSSGNQLQDGANTIASGAEELSNGMKEFDEEGIDTIYNLINGDLSTATDRVKKLVDLSNNEDDTTYKYVIKVDSIKK